MTLTSSGPYVGNLAKNGKFSFYSQKLQKIIGILGAAVSFTSLKSNKKKNKIRRVSTSSSVFVIDSFSHLQTI